ncbi:MAG: phosphoribosyl-AMP cyclohydrolase [Leptospiraceae bacterium]|nr:phosphoribosyl-AMP cyclohydrolase [Leptospiraceae bacterium]
MNILIYQDKYSKRISKVELLPNDILVKKLANEITYLIDCDEDAYILQKNFPPDPELARLSEFLPELQVSFFFPTIAQDKNGNILMVAFGNFVSIQQSFQTGYAHYFSRSRSKIWKKGEESGHTQKVIIIEYSRLYKYFVFRVEQCVAACHTGYYSCFYRKVQASNIENIYNQKLFEPEKIYAK